MRNSRSWPSIYSKLSPTGYEASAGKMAWATVGFSRSGVREMAILTSFGTLSGILGGFSLAKISVSDGEAVTVFLARFSV